MDLCPQVQDEDLCSAAAAAVCRGPLRAMEGKHKMQNTDTDTHSIVCVGVQNTSRYLS